MDAIVERLSVEREGSADRASIVQQTGIAAVSVLICVVGAEGGTRTPEISAAPFRVK